MGEVYDFMEYLEAKQSGLTVHELRAAKQLIENTLEESYLPEALTPESYTEYEMGDDSWPEAYPYILSEDLDKPKVRLCEHDEWIILELDYQAQCKRCKLNAWSAPW